jgi:dTDP-glucose 4,6-dehydratase
MKRYLVTGGAGFIGSNFINYLLKNQQDTAVFNLDALTYAGNPANLISVQNEPRYTFIHGDICDGELLNAVFSDNQFDAVIHFAAESHVDRSIKNPMVFIETNIVGTANLLRYAHVHWNSLSNSQRKDFCFIHISTDEVFGSLLENESAFHENTPYSPNSPYAASKAASDHLVRSFFHTYQFPAIITNCSNNYGPYQFPEKLIPLVILNAITGKIIPVYGDGMQIRDWLFVEDHCEAIALTIKKGNPGETYNIGGNNQWKNIDIIKKICEILDNVLPDSRFRPHENLIEYVDDRPGHDRRYAMNIEKVIREIGWQPKTSLKEGLEKTVKWYLENDSWVQDILSRPSFDQWIKKNYTYRSKAT